MMRRRRGRYRSPAAARLACASLALATGLYGASPLVALALDGTALRAGDGDTLRQAVDWGALREALKSDMGGTLPVQMASARPDPDELPAFGESFAATAAASAIDHLATPEHVLAMVGGAAGAARAAPASSLSWLGHVEHVAFLSPTRFEATLRVGDGAASGPMTVSMHIEKWRWRISRVQVPEQVLALADSRA